MLIAESHSFTIYLFLSARIPTTSSVPALAGQGPLDWRFYKVPITFSSVSPNSPSNTGLKRL